MSQIINAIPPDALLPVAGAMVGWVGHMLWFRAERAHVASDMARMRQFMRGNDEWFERQRREFMKPHAMPPAPPAIEADKPHDATVLDVAYPTQELRLVADGPQVAAGLSALADEVGLVQAVGCCTGHGDEPCAEDSGLVPPYCCDDCPDQLPALSDRPAADEDEVGDEQPGEALSSVPSRLRSWASDLVDRVRDAIRQWLVGVKHDLRQRFKTDAQREAEDRAEAEFWDRANQPAGEPLREVLAASGYELDIADEDELRLELEAWKAANPPTNPQPYTGRHWVSDVQHTGTFPVVKATGGPVNAMPYIEEPPGCIIPTQRDSGDDDA